MPPWVSSVVSWFWSLDALRSGQWVERAGYAPNPLSWPEIDAWARVNGIRLEPWEAEALKQMDGVRMRHFAEGRREPAKLSRAGFREMLGGGA